MAKINLRNAIESVLTLSPLMTGRAKMETSDIVNMTLTINQFDFAQINNAAYPVIVFSEFPNNYYGGGYVLNKICRQIADIMDNANAISDNGVYNVADFAEPIQIRLIEDKTNDGKRNITKVELI